MKKIREIAAYTFVSMIAVFAIILAVLAIRDERPVQAMVMAVIGSMIGCISIIVHRTKAKKEKSLLLAWILLFISTPTFAICLYGAYQTWFYPPVLVSTILLSVCCRLFWQTWQMRKS